MKITIVQGAFLPVPPLRGGAVERVWYGLGRAFAAKGHEVVHISRRFAELPNNQIDGGVRYQRILGYDAPPELWKLKLRDLRYSLRARRILPKSDVIVTHTFWLPILLKNSKCGRVCVNVQRYPKGQMRFYRHVARLQAVSNATKDAIIEQYPAGKHLVRVLPNHLDDSWFAPIESSVRDLNRILFVGRVHPEKGIDLLLKAFAKVGQGGENARLTIVGPWDAKAGGGGDAYYRSLNVLASNEGVKVEWKGPIYDLDNLIREYDQSSVFVYPSLADRGETFGVAPLEAMARGCRTVLSDLPCFQDFSQDGANCIVFSRHGNPVQNLADAIEKALGPHESDVMRRSAIDSARRFHLDHVSDMYLEDFRELCAS